MSTRDLAQFLNQQSSEGTSEGSGSFSLSLERAQELAKFQLPRETAWILLLVQAAVQWRCPRVSITQSRYTSRILLTPKNGEIPDSDEILGTFSKMEAKSDTAIQRLSLAIRVLLAQRDNEFELSLVPLDGDSSVLHYGSIHSSEKRPKVQPGSICLDLSHYHPPHDLELLPWLGARKEQDKLVAEIKRFCATCPISIEVNAFPLELELHLEQANDKAQYAPISLQTLGGCDFEQSLPMPITLRRQLEGCGSDIPDIGGLFTVSLRLPTKHEHQPKEANRTLLSWVQNGVIVQTDKVNIRTKVLCTHIMANADGLKTDLTGFQLRDNVAFGLRRREILTALSHELHESGGTHVTLDELVALEPRDHYKPHPVLGPAMMLTIFGPGYLVGSMVSLAGVLCLTYGWVPGGLGIGGVGATIIGASHAGYRSQPFKTIDTRSLGQCTDWIQEDFQKLRDGLLN